MDARQIGIFVLKEPKIYTRTFETAAWYENILVPAGEYPVVVHNYETYKRKDGSTAIDGHIGSVYVKMDGTITEDYFGTLFFGVPIGTYDETKNKGKPSTYHMQDYLYSMANSILHDPESPWKLLPEYEAREICFEYDGKPYVTHGIFLK